MSFIQNSKKIFLASTKIDSDPAIHATLIFEGKKDISSRENFFDEKSLRRHAGKSKSCGKILGVKSEDWWNLMNAKTYKQAHYVIVYLILSKGRG